MEEHVSWITQTVNHYLGGIVLTLLSALRIKPEHPELPIPEHVVMALVVLVLVTILALILKSRLSVERPGAFQQVAEMLITNPMGFGVRDLVEENVPHHPERHIAFVGSIGIFVLMSNLMGVFRRFRRRRRTRLCHWPARHLRFSISIGKVSGTTAISGIWRTLRDLCRGSRHLSFPWKSSARRRACCLSPCVCGQISWPAI